HGSVESVDGVVGDGDGLLDRVVGDEGQYRTEDLLLGDAHVVAHVGEDGGTNVVTTFPAFHGFGTTGDEAGSFLHTEPDVGADLLLLGRRHQRAHTGALLLRVSGRVRGRGRGSDFHSIVVGITVHQHAGESVTALPSVAHDVGDTALDRLSQVGIGQDEVRGLATQFQGDAFDGLGGHLGDTGSCPGGAGEGDHVHLLVCGDGLAHDRPGSGDQVEHTSR